MGIFIAVTVGICILAFFACFTSTRAMINAWKENEELKAQLEKQKRNSAYLATHAAEMARIERSDRKLKQEVKNAKSDEEIANIINTVLDRNNNLVQDNSKH